MAIPPGKPTLKALTPSVLQSLEQALREEPHGEVVAVWANQLLRVCELRLSDLKSLILPTGAGTRDRRTLLTRLCLFFLDYFEHSGDPRFINGVLRVSDIRWFQGGTNGDLAALQRQLAQRLDAAVATVAEPDWRAPRPVVATDRITSAPTLESATGQQPPSAPSAPVLIFCPSRYSLYTLAVAELLRRAGFAIEGVVVRRLWNISRFRSEFRRDRSALLRKILKKLILRRRAYSATAADTPASVLERLGVGHSSVMDWAAEYGVPVHQCGDFNEPGVVRLMEAAGPSFVAFTGGGIIREEVLSRAGLGVLNCHMGMLPRYRGMDVVEWALLERQPEAVGLCVHLMGRGLDEGDIIRLYRCDPAGNTSFVQLRERLEAMMPLALMDGIVALTGGSLDPLLQAKDDGRQYFRIHPRLRTVAETNLQRLE